MPSNRWRHRFLFGSSWTPKDMPGSDRGWWTSKDITGLSVGGAIVTVPSRLGGVDLTTTGSPTYQLGINGLPSALLTTSQLLKADGRATGFGGNDTPFSLFMALKMISVGTAQTIFCVANNPNSMRVQLRTNTTPEWNISRNDGSTITGLTGKTPNTNATVLGWVFNGTTLDFWINGIKVAAGVSCDAATLGVLTLYSIGCRRSNGGAAEFAEMHYGEHFETAGIAVTDTVSVNASQYLLKQWSIS